MTIESGTGGLYDVGTDVVPDPEYPGLYQVVPEPEPEPVDAIWGVSVPDVVALAPHVTVSDEESVPDDATFGSGAAQKIRTGDVRQWITDVGAVVDLQLRQRAQLTDQLQVARVKSAGASVVKVGAAAYLVDAAFPARSGVNDSTSYGNVLWTRYKEELAALTVLVDQWVAIPEPGAATGTIAGTFPEPVFTDTIRW